MLKNNTDKHSINTNNLLEKLVPIIDLSAKNLKLNVLDITFKKENGRYLLRIFIYNPLRPINHEDCKSISNIVSNTIEEMNILEVPYSIEVSSPGINRKLKNEIEFDIFKGKQVKIIINKPLQNEEKTNTFIGNLIGLSEDKGSVIIAIDDTEKIIPLLNIKTVQLDG
jgi:ribosome maturation factor RimP